MSEQHKKFLGNYENALERLVFFSDAVFAIAITLLALEIRLPDNTPPDQIFQAVWDQRFELLGFILSFLVVGSYWQVHHRMFRYIQTFDGRLISLNLLLLLFIALLPFPSSVLGHYGDTIQGFIVYTVTLLCIGLLIMAIYVYAYFNHRLIDPELPDQFIRGGFLRATVPFAVFLLSIPVAFISTTLAEFSWLLIAVARHFITRSYKELP